MEMAMVTGPLLMMDGNLHDTSTVHSVYHDIPHRGLLLDGLVEVGIAGGRDDYESAFQVSYKARSEICRDQLHIRFGSLQRGSEIQGHHPDPGIIGKKPGLALAHASAADITTSFEFRSSIRGKSRLAADVASDPGRPLVFLYSFSLNKIRYSLIPEARELRCDLYASLFRASGPWCKGYRASLQL